MSEPLFTRRVKVLNNSNGMMLYDQLRVDLFSASASLYPNMKSKLRLIRPRPNFYVISGNPNVNLGIVQCSLHTRRIALEDDCDKKIGMLAHTNVDYNYLEILSKIFIIPARQNQFILENIFLKCSISSDCHCN